LIDCCSRGQCHARQPKANNYSVLPVVNAKARANANHYAVDRIITKFMQSFIQTHAPYTVLGHSKMLLLVNVHRSPWTGRVARRVCAFV